MNFRLGIIPMSAYFLFFAAASKLWRKIFVRITFSKNNVHPYVPDRLSRGVYMQSLFYAVNGIGFIFVIHSNTSIYLFFTMALFYIISMFKSSKVNLVSGI
jgi:hypothetical protein